jgi:hypothetical protein
MTRDRANGARQGSQQSAALYRPLVSKRGKVSCKETPNRAADFGVPLPGTF